MSYNATGLNRRAAMAGASIGTVLGLSGLRLAAAQETSTDGHALVGTWFLTESSDNPTDADDVFILHADGTYIEVNASGSVRLGAWEATSPMTANLTIVANNRGEDGADTGGIILRLAITLNPDGNTYTAEGNIEIRSPDGTFSGQAGPVGGTATRFAVEAPGTPVMTPEELFGGMAEATPTA